MNMNKLSLCCAVAAAMTLASCNDENPVGDTVVVDSVELPAPTPPVAPVDETTLPVDGAPPANNQPPLVGPPDDGDGGPTPANLP